MLGDSPEVTEQLAGWAELDHTSSIFRSKYLMKLDTLRYHSASKQCTLFFESQLNPTYWVCLHSKLDSLAHKHYGCQKPYHLKLIFLIWKPKSTYLFFIK